MDEVIIEADLVSSIGPKVFEYMSAVNKVVILSKYLVLLWFLCCAVVWLLFFSAGNQADFQCVCHTDQCQFRIQYLTQGYLTRRPD